MVDSKDVKTPPNEGVEVEPTATLEDGDMKPMKVGKSTQEDSARWDNWVDWITGAGGKGKAVTPRKYQLISHENARRDSLYILRYAIMASAINTKILTPNYPLMATPGAHDDSFPSTDPFDFNSATYFIPMTTLLGVALSGIFVGKISDRWGRKSVLLIMALVSTIGSIVKYFVRHTFWGYNVASFIFGFFLGNLPVGMAYAGDVFPKKEDKESEMGLLVGCFVMGNSGGGMIAILMNSAGLFAPLLVGSGLMFLAFIGMIVFLIEPGDSRMVETHSNIDLEDDDDILKRPEQINQPVMWNVIFGALLDNIGSTGLFPLCLSPLAFEQYFTNPDLEEPIMSYTGYQWLSVCVALMVIPGTMITPYMFRWVGIAKTCVFGNLITAVVTTLLLMIANGPATQGYFIAFVFVMYGGFTFTVFSQLTTGPMLDVLAPEDQMGYVQGLNNMAMNFGMAFAPWLLGILADATSTNTAIWTGIGISVGAALANTPLIFRREMGKPIVRPPVYKRVLDGEDEEMVQKVLEGEFIPPDQFFELNRQRVRNRKAPLVPKVACYEDEKDSLDGLAQHAGETFRFQQDIRNRILMEMAREPDNTEKAEEFCELLNVATAKLANTDEKAQAEHDMGQWIGEYLADNGYNPHVNSVLVKQMVMTAFPTFGRDQEFTPDNLEDRLVRSERVMSSYLKVVDSQKGRYSFKGILGKQQGSITFYS